MGFWGTLAFLQASRPAETLGALGPWAELGMDSWHCGDGWQGVQFRHDDSLDWRSVLIEVMRETARPVVGAFVFDSDGACVLGAAPTSGNWQAVLEIEGVLAHLVLPEIEWVDGEEIPRTFEDDPDYLQEREDVRSTFTAMCGPVEDIARRATRWSAEAGYRAEAELITQALETTGGFVEEVFMKLVRALGLPDAASSAR
ncbi:hypothetical protein [Actinomadura sp. NPDC048394]|uniref:hypothetical protein n=1 Tax=Actinomadura sp. NPDC048394 TaxID=3158223 RepID=UPI0033D8C9C1